MPALITYRDQSQQKWEVGCKPFDYPDIERIETIEITGDELEMFDCMGLKFDAKNQHTFRENEARLAGRLIWMLYLENNLDLQTSGILRN
jgi:hypothetical protein